MKGSTSMQAQMTGKTTRSTLEGDGAAPRIAVTTSGQSAPMPSPASAVKNARSAPSRSPLSARMTPNANDAASGVSIATLARLRRCFEACALTSSECGMRLSQSRSKTPETMNNVEVAATQIVFGGNSMVEHAPTATSTEAAIVSEQNEPLSRSESIPLHMMPHKSSSMPMPNPRSIHTMACRSEARSEASKPMSENAANASMHAKDDARIAIFLPWLFTVSDRRVPESIWASAKPMSKSNLKMKPASESSLGVAKASENTSENRAAQNAAKPTTVKTTTMEMPFSVVCSLSVSNPSDAA